jgi:hypothetical protein
MIYHIIENHTYTKKIVSQDIYYFDNSDKFDLFGELQLGFSKNYFKENYWKGVNWYYESCPSYDEDSYQLLLVSDLLIDLKQQKEKLEEKINLITELTNET